MDCRNVSHGEKKKNEKPFQNRCCFVMYAVFRNFVNFNLFSQFEYCVPWYIQSFLFSS